LSAVLHADERNKGLSEKLGRDVWHYHLHVVYVPEVVGREIKYTVRAGKELQGKVKEVITQINHTDKWPRKKMGKGYFNEYSRLQDRYFEHMRSLGYDDLQRGEVGSTAEHLETLDYKIQQDQKQLDALATQMELTAEQIAMADETLKKKTAQAEKKAAELEKLNKEVAVKTKAAATVKEIDAMGHTIPLLPGVHFTNEEADKLKALAKKSVTLDGTIVANKKKIAALDEEITSLNGKLRDAQIEANH
jgi:DNA repair exonuclease SbcCD ATPase subunit